jgi:integrase
MLTMQTKLTKPLVQRLTEVDPPVRDINYFDIELRRFFLRVRPPRASGLPWVSSYCIRYTVAGREKPLKIGDAKAMTLDEARAAAKRKLAIVDSGGDPAAERTAAREAWTVRQAVAAYRASKEFGAKSPKGRDVDGGIFDNHILHHIAADKLSAIDVPAVKRLMRKVEADTRVNSRKAKLGGEGIARKVVRVLSALLTWCVGEGELERNPIIGNLRLDGGDSMRETVIRGADYAALFTAMDELVAEGELRPIVRTFFAVKALTGMRRGELQRLRVRDVNIVERRLNLVSTKGQKLAKKAGKPKIETVSLPPYVAAALTALIPENAAPDDLVFPPKQGKRLSVNRDWVMVRDRAKLPDDLVLHGLRHSAATSAIASGLSLPEVQKLLRHQNIATTAKYIHILEAAQSRLQDRGLGHLAPGTPARPRARRARFRASGSFG